MPGSMRCDSSLLSAIAVLGLACTAIQARTVVVGHGTGCPSPHFTNISDAVNAASSGDVINICPGLYKEQLLITKPVTLRGISVTGSAGLVIDRVLIQPSSMTALGGLGSQAVITALNTRGVVIEDLAVDAANNSVDACDPSLSTIHFLNSSGVVRQNAITGAKMANPSNCPNFFGNGFGVLVDSDGSRSGPFEVSIQANTIHDFTRNGIWANGPDVKVDIDGNSISGIGPGAGQPQFGIFVVGATGRVTDNLISEGLCGSLGFDACIALRSEGIVFRVAGDGSIACRNVITNAQYGIFLNGGNRYQIGNNVVRNIDIAEGIHLQGGVTNSIMEGNAIYLASPVANITCGIGEVPDGQSGNKIVNNSIYDGYCGVAYVSADVVHANKTYNTLYSTFNVELFPTEPPSPEEP